MNRIAIVVFFALVTVSAIRAEDDEWISQWVLPRSKDIQIRGKDGKEIMKWKATAAIIMATEKDSLIIRHKQAPGPYEGYVKKSDAVKLADAPKFFSEMIKNDKEDVWPWLCRSEVWLKMREFDKAIADLTEVIKLDPTGYHYNERGNASFSNGKFDKAIMDFDEALKLQPDLAIVFNNRGCARGQKGEFDKAIKDFDEAIRLDPTDTKPFCGRGITWNSKAEYDKAIKDLSEAIRLDQKNIDAIYYRARTWNAKLEYDKAIADYTEAIRIDPNNALFFNERGTVFFVKGEYEKAVKDLTEAIRLFPTYIFALNIRGMAWQAMKKYDKAIKDFDEVIRINASDFQTCKSLARLLATCPEAKFRNGKRAVELATNACLLIMWKDVDSIDTLATAYAEAGDFDQATKFEKKAIEEMTKLDEKRFGNELHARLKLFEQKEPYHALENKK